MYQLEWAKNRFSKPGNIWGNGPSERGQRRGTERGGTGGLGFVGTNAGHLECSHHCLGDVLEQILLLLLWCSVNKADIITLIQMLLYGVYIIIIYVFVHLNFNIYYILINILNNIGIKEKAEGKENKKASISQYCAISTQVFS